MMVGVRDGRLYRIAGDQVLPLKSDEALNGDAESSLLLQGTGPVWVRRGSRAVWAPEESITVESGSDGTLCQVVVQCATRSSAGGYWLATRSGVRHLRGKRLDPEIEAPLPEPSRDYHFIIEDGGGNLWLGAWGVGLFRREPGESWQRIGTVDPLPDSHIMALYQDREGNLWFGMGAGGLGRVKPRLFRTYDTGDGLSGDNIKSVAEGRDGRIWLGSNGGGLNCFQYGRIARHLLVYSVLPDKDDGLWIGLYGRGVLRLAEGDVTGYTFEEGYLQATPWALFQDRQGAVWLGTDRGLLRFSNDRFERYTRHQGLSHDEVRALAEDSAGVLYIGTSGGGLNCLRAGRFTAHSERDGLGDNHVAAL
jgi:ligand-binding sensor domain-containing protein